MGQKLIDETGKRYGSLIVLQITKDKNNRTAWLCQCDCGNQKIVRGSDLRTGKITTCGQTGCSAKRERSGVVVDEVGNHYGRLTVIKKSDKRTPSNKVLWECQCSCGNVVEVIAQSLRNGLTKSCGCLSKELASERSTIDITGEKFGKLLAIELTNRKHFTGSNIWKCKCECGQIVEVPTVYLRSGATKSCGCLLSWKEVEIKKILEQNNIIFKQQITFPDLITDKNIHYRYDFGLILKDKIIGIIEYHGDQHYYPSTLGKYNEPTKNLELYQQRDLIKKQYCEKNNIPLLILNKHNDLEKEILQFFKECKYKYD